LPNEWVEYFLNPPRFQDATGEPIMDGGMMAMPQQPFPPAPHEIWGPPSMNDGIDGWYSSSAGNSMPRAPVPPSASALDRHDPDARTASKVTATESNDGDSQIGTGLVHEIEDTASSEEGWQPRKDAPWQKGLALSNGFAPGNVDASAYEFGAFGGAGGCCPGAYADPTLTGGYGGMPYNVPYYTPVQNSYS